MAEDSEGSLLTTDNGTGETDSAATTGATETKSTGATDTAADGTQQEADAGEQAAPEGAPETYEPFAVPDGVEAEGPLLDQFRSVAKELKLPQAKAQQIVDLYTGAMQQMDEARSQAWQDVNNEWIGATKKDAEIGGAQFDASIRVAQKALREFGSDGLRQFLEETGGGNHPEVIRLLVKVGKAIAEHELVTSETSGAGARKSWEEVMYPTMTQGQG